MDWSTDSSSNVRRRRPACRSAGGRRRPPAAVAVSPARRSPAAPSPRGSPAARSSARRGARPRRQRHQREPRTDRPGPEQHLAAVVRDRVDDRIAHASGRHLADGARRAHGEARMHPRAGHESRRDRGHADAAAAEFLADARRPRQQAGGGGTVRRVEGHRQMPCDRGDIHDVAGSTLEHLGQHVPRELHRRHQVGLDQLVHAFGRMRRERPRDLDAGVVHQDVDAPEFGAAVVDEAGALRRVGEIGGDDDGADAVVAQRFGEAVEGVAALGPGGQCEVGAGLCEPAGEPGTEAAGRAGDQHRPTGQHGGCSSGARAIAGP